MSPLPDDLQKIHDEATNTWNRYAIGSMEGEMIFHLTSAVVALCVRLDRFYELQVEDSYHSEIDGDTYVKLYDIPAIALVIIFAICLWWAEQV